MGFLSDFKVLLNVELGGDAEVYVDAHHLVKVAYKLIINLQSIFIVFVYSIQHQRN